jgi:flagellar biosynthesis protein FlhB
LGEGAEFFRHVLALCLPLLLAVGLAAAVALGVQTGGIISTRKLALDLQRLNPIEGAKRFFSATQLFAVVRALIAAALVTWLAVRGLGDHVIDLARLAGRPRWIGTVVEEVAGALTWKVALLGVGLGVLDVLVTRRRWLRDLRMTKDEKKKEHKESEGDPQHKAERERARQEMLRQESVANVRSASVVVVNPTHLACALRYNVLTGDEAPVVLATGEGTLAEKIVQEARDWSVPVVQNVPLAHALVELRLGEIIPEALYSAVSELLHELWMQQRAEAAPDGSAVEPRS